MQCTHCQREIADYSNYCYFCGAQVANASGGDSPRRLRRSATDVKIAGVCGGIAEYFGTDPTIVRLLWVVLTIVGCIVLGVIAYGAAWIIMPAGRMPSYPAHSTAAAPQS